MSELSGASLTELLLETKARLLGRSDVRALQRNVLQRYWVVPQEQLEECLKYLKTYASAGNYVTPGASATATGVLANGESYAGTWANAGVGIEAVEKEKGRLCVVQRLAKVTTLTVGDAAGKSLTRAQELAGLGWAAKSAWDVTDTGGAGTWARGGVDLVTVVEGVDPASRAFVEADAAGGILAADLVTGFGLTGYVVTRRECEPANDGATCTVVLGWTKASGKTWAANKGMVGGRDEGGTGLTELQELRGMTPAEGDAAWLAAGTANTDRVVASRDLLLAAGRAVVRQSGRVTYAGTGDADATVIKIRSIGDSGKGLVRVWPRRTATAKGTLTGTGGKAVSGLSYTFPGGGGATSLVHVDCVVDDHGDGAWSVTQILAENALVFETWATGYTYHYPVRKMQTRTADDHVKLITYTQYLAMRSTEKAAWDAIKDWTGATVNEEIVEGSDGVVQKGKYQFLARWLTLDATITTGGVGDWGALPAAPGP